MIKDENINAIIIANYFLTKSELTPKKLQKLVYYSYSWFIALNNEKANEINCVLFDEQPEAWLHGPVFRTLYDAYKSYTWHEVEKSTYDIKFENDEIAPFLDKIYETYGVFDADQLEYMTHQELPWINARKGVSKIGNSNNKIDIGDIFNYYNTVANEN